MQRIYLPHISFGDILSISEKELYHQITRVLRARVGQSFIFFDGVKSIDFLYEISEIDAHKVVFLLREKSEKSAEVFPQMHLYQALPNKLEKLEYIIQKSCEVGYQSITFFQAERSQILVLSESKKQRLQKIAIEAIEQCGGNSIPNIKFQSDFILSFFERSITLLCHTENEDSQKLTDISLESIEHINILVGPEGGFSSQELAVFEVEKIQKICFGNRIFRTETVAPLLGFYLTQKKEV